MASTTYLIIASVAALIFYGAYHYVHLLIRTTNPIYGILMTCAGAGGLFYIKQSELTGGSREDAVSISTLALFLGIAAFIASWLNKSIQEDERTLKSVVKRFVGHYKTLK